MKSSTVIDIHNLWEITQILISIHLVHGYLHLNKSCRCVYTLRRAAKTASRGRRVACRPAALLRRHSAGFVPENLLHRAFLKSAIAILLSASTYFWKYQWKELLYFILYNLFLWRKSVQGYSASQKAYF